MTARPTVPDAGVRTRRYAIAYSSTLVVGAVGPAVLIVLGLRGESWRAETEPFFSLVAQVIPVLLLAFAVEQNLLRRSGRAKPVNDTLGMLVFLAVIVTAAVAEILALILLAFPCDPGSTNCGSWPPGLTGAATLAAATGIPAAFALIVLHGAITSELPWTHHARAVGQVANIAVRTAVGAMTFITSGGILLAVGARAGTIAAAVLLSGLSALFTRLRDQDGGTKLEVEVFGQGVTLERVDIHLEGDGDDTYEHADPDADGRNSGTQPETTSRLDRDE